MRWSEGSKHDRQTDQKRRQEIQRKISQIAFDRRERGVPHNPYDQEQREVQSIRTGDIEALRKSLAETYVGEEGELADNPLRSAKNIAMVILTLASRAAIEGGILPEKSFTIFDGYAQYIECLTSIEEVYRVARDAEFYYTSLVADSKHQTSRDALCEKCKRYIFNHSHESLKIKTIADALGVNADYLSSKFHRVENMTLKEYIFRERIQQGKDLLRYTFYSISAISAYLDFYSQSHFGQVFKKYEGITPKEYRQLYGKKEFE